MNIQTMRLPSSVALQPGKAAIGLRSVSSLTPPFVYSNDEIAQALNLPALPKICGKIGILKRRTFAQLDKTSGNVIGAFDDLEIEKAWEVASKAIDEAGVSRDSITVLWYISCTVQKNGRIHFELASHELAERLRLSRTVHRFESDAGCDGFVHALHTMNSLFCLQPKTNALIVATSVPSVYLDREVTSKLPNEAKFPNYVFGDGAAAAVVSPASDASGIIQATYGEIDSTVPIGSTMLHSGGHDGLPQIAYKINYDQVDKSYAPAVARAVAGLAAQYPTIATVDFDRAYFHQANGVLPGRVATMLGIPLDKLPDGAKYDGNTASACIPTLIARDIESRIIGRGSRLLLGAVGAGMACSAAYIEY